MYTITFYSFKGGVGRTMAMVNVGLALARAGRRVLLVDFDLEAPGLDTFDLLKSSESTPGLVDFVTEYRKTCRAPDVKQFLYKCSDPALDAKVWVMPTGRQDANYGNRLNAIDWRQLYAEEHGYFLFEDLKEQWARELKPDYVLIDSRTGHTDVGGICTRQLPNAVVLMFFPNEQNRRGLETVVRDIKLEARETGRTIDLYFVGANVPDLDDEDNILRQRLREFTRTLERQPDALIHHYDSMSLLQQVVFTIQRPQTKLAREYDDLAQVITSKNLEDRSVISKFLETPAERLSLERIDTQLERIAELYAEDGAILYALAKINRELGRGEYAERFFKQAEKLGFLSEEAFAEQAAQHYAAGELEDARQLVRRALALVPMRVFRLVRLFLVVVERDTAFLSQIFGLLNAKGIEPPDRLYVSNQLPTRRDALPAIAEFVSPLLVDPRLQDEARSAVSLCLIGQGLFTEAKAFILNGIKTPAKLRIQDAFNFAMATWGETREIPRHLFARVVELDKDTANQPGANYFQCLAISNWALGDIETARQLSAKSRSSVNKSGFEFSAWRYLKVKRLQFLSDIDLLDDMILTGEGEPAILSVVSRA